jgi:CRISPR-associated protein Csm2
VGVTHSKPGTTLFIKPAKDHELHGSQLRKYHKEARSLEGKYHSLAENQSGRRKRFDELLPLVKLLKAKVAYACPSNAKERKVPDEFRKFMEEMIDNITDAKDFEAFTKVFEAAVGYFYGEGGRQ